MNAIVFAAAFFGASLGQSISADLIAKILIFLVFIVIADVVMSWLINFNIVNMRNPTMATIVHTIHRISEPIVSPFRKILPPIGGLDFSPVAAIFILQFIAGLFMPGGPIWSALG